MDGIDLAAGTDDQIEVLTEGVELSRALLRAAATAGRFGGGELNTRSLRGRDAVAQFVRKHASSVWHLTSTCRISSRPENGVVDTRLRVHGVRGLRIVDASVLPTTSCSGTTAPIMAVAFRAAQLVAEERRAAGAAIG